MQSSASGSTRRPHRARSSCVTPWSAASFWIVSELGVHQAIRHFLGLGVPLTDELLEYRGYTDELVKTPLERNVDCPVDHQRWRILPRGDHVQTLRAAVDRAGLAGPCTVRVERGMDIDAACGQLAGRAKDQVAQEPATVITLDQLRAPKPE